MDAIVRENHGKPRLTPPSGEDFWVFGYGSLIWRPGFPHLEMRGGLLRGYHRRFCIYSYCYRGTPEAPGLVLGLARGGSCRGVVFRVRACEGETVMNYLHEREMVFGVYDPRWVKVDTSQGRVCAASYVVDTTHPQYTGHLSQEEMACLVIQGRGSGGTCLEYLRNTVTHLEALGMHDRALKSLLSRIEERDEADRAGAGAMAALSR